MAIRRRLMASLLLGAGVVSACAVVGPVQDPAAEVLVTGRLLDAAGQPMVGGEVSLTVRDEADHQVGEPVPVVLSATTLADGSGNFTFRLEPTPALRAAGARNGGWVNFHLQWFDEPTHSLAVFDASRQIVDAGWAGDPESIVLQPVGSG